MDGDKFSQVPEWVIDADISDTAFRLYAVLLRYAKQETKRAFPSRSTLAKRMGRGVKTIDRALKDLVDVEAIKVIHRYRGETGEKRSNEYQVMTKKPK